MKQSVREYGRAFTLVELLVSIATIGLLIAIALPALTTSRNAAEISVCSTRLAIASRAHASFSASNRDEWLNPLPPGILFAFGHTGETGATIVSRVLEATPFWGYFMGSELVDQGESGEAVTCPVVHRAMGPGQDMQTRAGAVNSYWYSAAMVTDWRLWRLEAVAPRMDPDRHRARVGTSMVSHPSRKVALFEWSDWHSKQQSRLDAPERPARTASNVAYADGHVERVAVSNVRPALRVAWPPSPFPEHVPSGEPLPFSSSVDGYRGWDK